MATDSNSLFRDTEASTERPPERECCPDDGRYGFRPHLVVDGVCYTCAGEEDARRARLEERGIF